LTNQIDRGDFLVIDKTMKTELQVSPDLVQDCAANVHLVQKFENNTFRVFGLERD
jgi:hypothetical protein